jgi:hypothetical protein
MHLDDKHSKSRDTTFTERMRAGLSAYVGGDTVGKPPRTDLHGSNNPGASALAYIVYGGCCIGGG